MKFLSGKPGKPGKPELWSVMGRKWITLSQVQKIPSISYQIYQTLQIYLVYEKDDIKYKYDRKWKTENMAEKQTFQV